ncbi:hypothetical protein RJ639_032036 [Escallonia herrerae]|uniref:galactinol--sucrose galactosyltransferase n=1 Tax=Escallonia herrerae TaxID=1293975 RepID=A0AA89BIQ8_9ASTE|nr:hypothetical protein RJ639_032036 [Escallonia herrerae]
MTITPAVRIVDQKLVVKGRTILENVPENVIQTSGSDTGPAGGMFIGAALEKDSSRHVVSLGTLRGVRFMACFRFKLWWMAQKMGDQGRDIPLETQFLLLETKDGSHLASDGGNGEDQIVYTVFLPLIEGPFRACLQGSPEDKLDLCLESGDKETTASAFTHSVFVSAGTDPFGTITDAIRAVKMHLKSFRQRHEKKLPGLVDYFGWCTWDAFYQDVTQEGVEAGLDTLATSGTPPKFVIIDDGWQSVGGDPLQKDETKELEAQPQSQLMRLTGVKENSKFQNKDDPTVGIKSIVKIAKEKYGLKYVYVWHAITGYWGGVLPGVEGMDQYESSIKYPTLSNGVSENEPGWKTDILAVRGLGLMNPKNVYKFYNELHGYLASAGIDGVKVDVQCVLETLGAGLGGRVELTRQYHQALDASVARNFPDNVLADVVYFLGSDAPGKHNFDLLKKLVLPDGSVLRARLPGRPTKDCLFSDPARDGISLLKIWNMNKYTGVLGVYNCQGAAWSSIERKNTFHKTGSDSLTGFVRGSDVHFIADVALDPDWKGDCAVYSHRSGQLVTLPYNAAIPVSLKVLEHEIFTVTPTKILAPGSSFAPLGLIDMFNAGGAIEGLKYEVMGQEGNGYQGEIVESSSTEVIATALLEVKGCGRFGAYSSVQPKNCKVGSMEVEFAYDSALGLVTFNLDHMPEDQRVHIVEVVL